MNNKTINLPCLRVTAIGPESLSISFHELKWIGERWIACIMLSSGKFVWGRFASINTEDRTAQFTLDNKKEASLLQTGSEYKYLDAYWGERAELVFDSSHNWQKTEFVPRNSVRHFINGTTENMPGGWDHEHCQICWESISQVDEQKYGYKDQNNKWLCDQCFHSYVEQKKIDFITESQQSNQGNSMKTENINFMKVRHNIIALVTGLINVGLAVLFWNTYSSSQIIEKIKMIWGTLNIIPFIIAFYIKHYGHEIDFTSYYLSVFVQWFLLTIFFLKLKGLVREKKLSR